MIWGLRPARNAPGGYGRASMTPAKTDDQWVAEIRAQHARTVDGILELGRMLIAAKADLGHGKFQIMISRRLPFDKSTAQKLMKIAKDPRIANAAQARLLPSSWTTIIELAKLDDGTFGDAAASGAINPKMTRKDAKRLTVEVTHERPFKAPGKSAVTQGPTTTVVPRMPVTIDHEPGTAQGQRAAEEALAEIENAAGDLIGGVLCGEIKRDLIAERVRRVIGRLQALLATTPETAN
jgi:hypothetical protein